MSSHESYSVNVPAGCDAAFVPIDDSSAVLMVLAEIKRQDEIHPDGFPATRDGLRLGLAAMQDELDETREAWRADRRNPDPCPWLNATEGELSQTIAVGLRMLRSIHAAAGPARGEW